MNSNQNTPQPAATPKLSAGRTSTNPYSSHEFYSPIFVEGTPYCVDLITPSCVNREEHEQFVNSICRAVNFHEALVSIAEGVLSALSYPRGSEAQVRCLEEVGQDAKAVLAKAKPTTTKEAFAQ